ncbi:MAG: hypothetical protein WD063_08105 [Pirellulales bacterium]
MDATNLTSTRAMDWLLSWSAQWSPLATLLVWSAVAGVLMTVVFRYTSNQQGLKTAADRSRAQVLAINLFGHELHAIFASLGQLFRHTGLRLWYSLPPMLVMLVPFVLLLSQLALRYEYRPLACGQSTIVKLELAEKDWPQFRSTSLEPSSKFVVESPPLHDPEEHAIYWRVSPKSADATTLVWRIGDESVEKRLDVDDGQERLAVVSTRRPGRGFWDRLLHPAEPAMPAESPVCGIQIEHPRRVVSVFGLDLPWWLTFLLASMVTALLIRPFLKVRF